MKKTRNNSGFTLIEVLIVISIIGLLSAATLIGLGTFRGQGRDARRLGDLRQIQNGLELIYAKTGEYPADISDATFKAANIGVSAVPVDPNTGDPYEYSKNGCTTYSYILATTLDAESGSKIYADSAASDCGKTCTPKLYCIGF